MLIEATTALRLKLILGRVPRVARQLAALVLGPESPGISVVSNLLLGALFRWQLGLTHAMGVSDD